MTDGKRLWRGEGLGKLCDHGGLIHTDCVNIMLIQKIERMVKLSALPLLSTPKHKTPFPQAQHLKLLMCKKGLIPQHINSVENVSRATLKTTDAYKK